MENEWVRLGLARRPRLEPPGVGVALLEAGDRAIDRALPVRPCAPRCVPLRSEEAALAKEAIDAVRIAVSPEGEQTAQREVRLGGRGVGGGLAGPQCGELRPVASAARALQQHGILVDKGGNRSRHRSLFMAVVAGGAKQPVVQGGQFARALFEGGWRWPLHHH